MVCVYCILMQILNGKWPKSLSNVEHIVNNKAIIIFLHMPIRCSEKRISKQKCNRQSCHQQSIGAECAELNLIRGLNCCSTFRCPSVHAAAACNSAGRCWTRTCQSATSTCPKNKQSVPSAASLSRTPTSSTRTFWWSTWRLMTMFAIKEQHTMAVKILFCANAGMLVVRNLLGLPLAILGGFYTLP
jgi:hypothetical protein